jgi:hypothetical protein
MFNTILLVLSTIKWSKCRHQADYLTVFERNQSHQKHQTGVQHQVHTTEHHLARPSRKTP